MLIKPDLQLRLKLNLNLLLKNQIELLLYPAQELEQILKEEKESNPFIEEVYVSEKVYNLFEERKPLQIPARESSFEELLRNVRAEFIGKELEIALELVSLTDGRGFFKGDTKEIARKFGVGEEYVENIRRRVTRLDPLGVCSKDLREFLEIQIEDMYPEEKEELCTYLEFALEGKKIPEDARRKLSHLKISPLEGDTPPPRIGRVDAVIELDDGELVFYLYEELIDIKPSKSYLELYQRSKGETRKFLREYVERLENLKRLLSIRRENLRKILSVIVEVQEDFLKGEGSLKSLLVKDVARMLDVSESTVSRLINSKYVKTPQGTYPLRFFFVRESVGGTSQEEIMKAIRELILAEDKKKPLSDEEIAKILKERGINIARRTVAKYRESMGIPSSRERRI